MKEYYYIRVASWSDYDFKAYGADHDITQNLSEILFFDNEDDAIDMMKYLRIHNPEDYTFSLSRL